MEANRNGCEYGGNSFGGSGYTIFLLLADKELCLALILAIAGSTPLFKRFMDRVHSVTLGPEGAMKGIMVHVTRGVSILFVLGTLFVAVLYLTAPLG